MKRADLNRHIVFCLPGRKKTARDLLPNYAADSEHEVDVNVPGITLRWLSRKLLTGMLGLF